MNAIKGNYCLYESGIFYNWKHWMQLFQEVCHVCCRSKLNGITQRNVVFYEGILECSQGTWVLPLGVVGREQRGPTSGFLLVKVSFISPLNLGLEPLNHLRNAFEPLNDINTPCFYLILIAFLASFPCSIWYDWIIFSWVFSPCLC